MEYGSLEHFRREMESRLRIRAAFLKELLDARERSFHLAAELKHGFWCPNLLLTADGKLLAQLTSPNSNTPLSIVEIPTEGVFHNVTCLDKHPAFEAVKPARVDSFGGGMLPPTPVPGGSMPAIVKWSQVHPDEPLFWSELHIARMLSLHDHTRRVPRHLTAAEELELEICFQVMSLGEVDWPEEFFHGRSRVVGMVRQFSPRADGLDRVLLQLSSRLGIRQQIMALTETKGDGDWAPVINIMQHFLACVEQRVM